MPDLLPDPFFFQQLAHMHASSSVILRDEHGRIVVEYPNYRNHWLLPGGCIDAGEDARLAAQREVREELGIPVEIGRMLLVSWVAASVRSGSSAGIHFLFDAGTTPEAQLRSTIRIQESELDGWGFIDESQLHKLSSWGAARTRYGLDVLAGLREPGYIGPDGRIA